MKNYNVYQKLADIKANAKNTQMIANITKQTIAETKSIA